MEQKLLSSNWTVEQAKNAWLLIQNSSKIALLTHIQPDPDGMAACAALEEILINSHKNVQVIYPDKSNYAFSIQPKNVCIGSHKQIPDLLISLDVSTVARFYLPEEFKNIKMINIDHHLDNDISGTFNFVNSSASSA